LHADASFQLLQLLTQRWLRDVQPCRRPAEVQLLGENEKRGDVS
jgi:hypothetical protein